MAISSVAGRQKDKVGSLTPLAVKMSSRSQEIRPVGAWVEPSTQCDFSAVVSDLSFYARASTRGNNYKLVNHSFHYDLRKHFFLHVL